MQSLILLLLAVPLSAHNGAVVIAVPRVGFNALDNALYVALEVRDDDVGRTKAQLIEEMERAAKAKN